MATSKDPLGHDTKLEGGGTPVLNTGLFRHFPPDVAAELCCLPSQVRLPREDKSKETKKQRWTLTVVVAHDKLAEAEKYAEHYAERIRDADPVYWPDWLTVEFVGADKAAITSKMAAQRQAWSTEHESPQDIVQDIRDRSQLEVPVRTPQDITQFDLSQVFIERTETEIEEIKELRNADKDEQRTIHLGDPNKEKDGGRKLLYAVFNYAIAYGASDIHVEWLLDKFGLPNLRIRIRIDGVLWTIAPETGGRGKQMLGILAIMAGQNAGLSEMACHVAPSNGTVPVKTADGRRYDCRISFTPVPIASTTFNAVIRIQDMSRIYRFNDLGFSPWTQKQIRYALDADRGMIVFNGPTGSGKNVSMFGCMLELPYEELKIFTVENPIELRWSWFHQCQVDDRDDSKSAAAYMRAAMRCDPDVIMIAEVRDKEIADVAISAVNSGHQVFTTIHAQDALRVPHRLHELTGDLPAVANTLSLVVAQRLFRRPVGDRWVQTKLTTAEIERQLGFSVADVKPEILKDFTAPQLKSEYKLRDVNNYRGRIGVHEALRFDEELREIVRKGGSAGDLYPIARGKGMITLLEDALEKAKQGFTTLEEIRGLRDV